MPSAGLCCTCSAAAAGNASADTHLVHPEAWNEAAIEAKVTDSVLTTSSTSKVAGWQDALHLAAVGAVTEGGPLKRTQHAKVDDYLLNLWLYMS